MLQPCTFIESIKWQFLNKWYSVNYYVVTLCSKLYSLALLASDYRSDVRFADAYNSIRDALARVTTIKVILLLFLNLQLLGQFQQYVVNQLIVCQLAFGTDSDSTEDLIMDISIQCLHQFRRGQTGIFYFHPLRYKISIYVSVRCVIIDYLLQRYKKNWNCVGDGERL